MVLIHDVSAIVFAVLPRPLRVLRSLSLFSALVGAVRLSPCHREVPAAHRAGRRLPLQGPFRYGIGREDGVFKVVAQTACPPIVEHVALAVQRQAAVFAVIAGEQGCHQATDFPVKVGCQFPWCGFCHLASPFFCPACFSFHSANSCLPFSLSKNA